VDSGLSSFMVEMTDAAYILQNVTDSSLVIIDELGRGIPFLTLIEKRMLANPSLLATTTSDALAIATAVCEELIMTKVGTQYHDFKRSGTRIHNLIAFHDVGVCILCYSLA
jgi:DNA mismatch repair protein MSH4